MHSGSCSAGLVFEIVLPAHLPETRSDSVLQKAQKGKRDRKPDPCLKACEKGGTRTDAAPNIILQGL